MQGQNRKPAQEALADFKQHYLPEVEKDAPKILFNRARCRKCGTFLESKHVHDMQTCACGAVSIDGGLEYIRQLAVDLNDIEDLTEYAP